MLFANKIYSMMCEYKIENLYGPATTFIKVPHWYAVQVSDTTMLPRAASLLGQKWVMNDE